MVAKTAPEIELQQPVQVSRWAFSTTDYHRMLEVGIFTEDDRVELIDGEVRVMSPIGARHVAFVNRLIAVLVPKVGNTAIVSVQNPVQLGDYTEPQPDLLLLRPRDDFYVEVLPRAADVLLVIEVSDTTLGYDRQEKLPRYARAGIPEVWIVVADSQPEKQMIERYTDPHDNQYATKQTFKRGQSISILALPQITISVESIFG
jgi:Uma2 family endonuclease